MEDQQPVAAIGDGGAGPEGKGVARLVAAAAPGRFGGRFARHVGLEVTGGRARQLRRRPECVVVSRGGRGLIAQFRSFPYRDIGGVCPWRDGGRICPWRDGGRMCRLAGFRVRDLRMLVGQLGVRWRGGRRGSADDTTAHGRQPGRHIGHPGPGHDRDQNGHHHRRDDQESHHRSGAAAAHRQHLLQTQQPIDRAGHHGGHHRCHRGRQNGPGHGGVEQSALRRTQRTAQQEVAEHGTGDETQPVGGAQVARYQLAVCGDVRSQQ